LNGKEILSLQQNRLGGLIPTSIGSMISLREFKAFFNNFNGTLPHELGNLRNLGMNREKPGSPFPYRAYVAVSNFHQAFSNILCFLSLTFVSGLPPVASLSLYNNQLEGAIPTEFGLLTNMGKFN